MNWKLLLTLLVLFSSGIVRCHPPTVEEIFDAYVDVMGGTEHWRKLQSWKRTSHRKNGLEVISFAKKPDQFQLVFSRNGNTAIKSYDGHNGWLELDGNYQEMRPGEEIEMAEEPEFYEDLIIAREEGFPLFMEGEEVIGGVACYKISMTKSQTDKQWYWINKKSYMLEMVGEYSEDPAHDGIFYTTRFEDYRDIDGYLIPFTEHLIRNGKDTTSIYYTEMQVNPDLDDPLFAYQPKTIRNTIAWMQDEFAENYLEAYTFVQETIMYTEWKVDTALWYETIVFPDQFRIDFNEPLGGNTNLNVGDTLYAFRGGELRGKIFEPHSFLLMEGGIFHQSVAEAMNKLYAMQLDTNAFRTDTFNGEVLLVLGTMENETHQSELWISQKTGKVVRSIEFMGNGKQLDMQVTQFQSVSGHEIPKNISFYVDGELVQTEEYIEVDASPDIPSDFFNLKSLSNNHWFQQNESK
ncbi:MAG: outer membrane lipoprotein-sorting protein [bacterium]|nr:outer membrane lipoprotein-sorting protein [bacterium]